MNRTAVVTGAGRGLGRAIATALARNGISVMAVALESDELKSLASEIDVAWVAETVGTVSGRDHIVSQTLDQFGRIDILVNNAGLSYGQLAKEKLPIWDAESDVWSAMLGVNLTAPFELMRRVAPNMTQRGWGRIINISSTAGLVGIPGMSGYCASKHGLIGLSKSVAQDVARYGVTCNAIAPGYMRTRASETSARLDAERLGITVEEVWTRRGGMYPSGRILTTEEVAETAAFLASDAASGINGEVIAVTMGGLI